MLDAEFVVVDDIFSPDAGQRQRGQFSAELLLSIPEDDAVAVRELYEST